MMQYNLILNTKHCSTPKNSENNAFSKHKLTPMSNNSIECNTTAVLNQHQQSIRWTQAVMRFQTFYSSNTNTIELNALGHQLVSWTIHRLGHSSMRCATSYFVFCVIHVFLVFMVAKMYLCICVFLEFVSTLSK